jgi:SAM-dependent methyltransferase/uncharacterized protein YbaR (Trm112 family)
MQPSVQQRIGSKRGEVAFRRQLARQQSVGGTATIPEAHTREEILAVMAERMEQTRCDMAAIAAAGLPLSPYIEVGAERCQRALILENEMGATGFAVDISFDMLRYATVIANAFGYRKMPLRVACDAYNLPFRNGSLAMSFCYQTLHHFPSPLPICGEIGRALGHGGTLFIDDEPVRGYIKHLTRLYHRRSHQMSALERAADRLGLLSVLSKTDELEREHDILEEEFGTATWRRALAGFSLQEVVINRRLNLRMSSLGISPRAALADLVGGNIRVLARKDGSGSNGEAQPFGGDRLALLGCPSCAHRPGLTPSVDVGLECAACGAVYPLVDGVYLLFEPSLGRMLYPEYFAG